MREGDKFRVTPKDGVCAPGWYVWTGQCFRHSESDTTITVYALKLQVELNSGWLKKNGGYDHTGMVHNYEFMAEQLIGEGSI